MCMHDLPDDSSPAGRTVPLNPRLAAGVRDQLGEALSPAFFKVLGDATRVRLFVCLARCRRACTVGELSECCSVDLSVVSRQLSALAESGLVTSERRGRVVWYTAQTGALADRLEDVSAALRALSAEPCGEDDCCGPGCC